MLMMRWTLGAALLALSLGAAAQAGDVPPYVAQAVTDTTRPKEDQTADAIRLPAFTLAFAGVKPGMTVGELYPCGGYFSRLLSDVVGPEGKVIGLETTRWKDCLPADQKMVAALPQKNMTVTAFPFGEFSLPEKVDLFWITQNYHDLHIKDYGNVDMAAFNRHVFESLKPGGTYFIVDHQATATIDDATIAKLHRIWKAQLVAEVTAAGFKLVDQASLPNGTTDDHTKPIFDPSVRGKTDQYLLKFVKP
jgi:predicted methyltransferase